MVFRKRAGSLRSLKVGRKRKSNGKKRSIKGRNKRKRSRRLRSSKRSKNVKKHGGASAKAGPGNIVAPVNNARSREIERLNTLARERRFRGSWHQPTGRHRRVVDVPVVDNETNENDNNNDNNNDNGDGYGSNDREEELIQNLEINDNNTINIQSNTEENRKTLIV